MYDHRHRIRFESATLDWLADNAWRIAHGLAALCNALFPKQIS